MESRRKSRTDVELGKNRPQSSEKTATGRVCEVGRDAERRRRGPRRSGWLDLRFATSALLGGVVAAPTSACGRVSSRRGRSAPTYTLIETKY